MYRKHTGRVLLPCDDQEVFGDLLRDVIYIICNKRFISLTCVGVS